jgi:uncharacterized membrane protein
MPRASLTHVQQPTLGPRRIESIDVVRGVIMILMALDHTRDFFGVPGLNPGDLARTTVPLFLARWVTHFCAPVFFLLMGTGAYLSLGRRRASQLSRLLVTRGLWLIVLELTVVRCIGFQFNVDYHVTMLVVLWALGWALIVLAVLVFLPPTTVAIIGVVMIATHNLLDPISARSLGALGPLWSILHAPGIVFMRPDYLVFVAYPLIPWIGVTAVDILHPGAWLGILVADRLRRLDGHCGVAVSRVRVVCALEAAARRLVAQLPVAAHDQRHEAVPFRWYGTPATPSGGRTLRP